MEKLPILQNKKQKKWLIQLEKLKDTTNLCKICFKEIKINNIHSLMNTNYICSKCQKNMHPIFKKFEINKASGLAIYNYNETLKKLIFMYKGCKDYELKNVFISQFINELKVMYKNYYIVYIPSAKKHDIERGFNHVRSVFDQLKLKELNVLEKINEEKQSSKNFKQRLKVKSSLKVNNGELIRNKKILIVDDIVTTGSTISSSIDLIREFNPKEIRVLVIAKRDFTKEEKEIISNKDFILN